jgi:hypothetical protein
MLQAGALDPSGVDRRSDWAAYVGGTAHLQLNPERQDLEIEA